MSTSQGQSTRASTRSRISASLLGGLAATIMARTARAYVSPSGASTSSRGARALAAVRGRVLK